MYLKYVLNEHSESLGLEQYLLKGVERTEAKDALLLC
jgi:hypothetical protein